MHLTTPKLLIASCVRKRTTVYNHVNNEFYLPMSSF